MKKSGINILAVAALISALIVFAGIIISQLGSIEIAEPVECTEPVVVGMPEVIDRRIIASDTYELLYKTTFSNGLSFVSGNRSIGMIILDSGRRDSVIKTDYYTTRSDGVNLYRSYSDKGVMIRKDGTDELYCEAIDVEDSGYTYSETDIPIEGETGDDTEQKAAAFDYLTGRAESE